MKIQISRLLLGAACAVFLGACHADGKAVHNCPTEHGPGWSGHGLDLEHELPDECPVFIPSAGYLLTTGATVFDGGTEEFEEAYLNVRDFSGDIVGLEFEPFRRANNGSWGAPIYADYPAGRDNLSPDKAYFRLTYFGGVPGPEATMKIYYTNQVMASVSGPGAVASGSTVTYTADVSAGQAPFTYQWYQDWVLVSTSDSYTEQFTGDAKIYLRLDVTDARGEVASYRKDVVVSSCDGEVIC